MNYKEYNKIRNETIDKYNAGILTNTAFNQEMERLTWQYFRDNKEEIDKKVQKRKEKDAKEKAARQKAKESVKTIQNKDSENKTEQTTKNNNSSSTKSNSTEESFEEMCSTYEGAKKIVDLQIDEMMEKQLDEIQKQYGFSKDVMDQIRATIRGYKTIRLNEEVLISGLERKAEGLLKGFIDKEVNMLKKSPEFLQFQKIRGNISEVSGKIDSFVLKLDNLSNLDEAAFAEKVSGSITTALNKAKSFEEVAKKIDTAFDKLGLPGVNTSSMLGPWIKNLTNVTGKGLAQKIQPIIKKQIGALKAVSTVIKNVNQAIQKFETKVYEMIDKWKTTATEWMKTQEQKLISSVVSSIKISF